MTEKKKIPAKFLIAPLVIFVAAVLLRLAVAAPGFFAGDEERFSRPDTPGYMIPAQVLAEEGYYPGTGRVPGFPAFASLFFKIDRENAWRYLVVTLSVIGGATTLLVFGAGVVFSFGIGVTAALLYALNLTAVANSPMLLSDTLAGFFSASQFLLFVLFWKRKEIKYFFFMILCASFGALIRPINLLWFLPALVLLFFVPGKVWTVRKKLLYALPALLLFWAVITPWMIRNLRMDAGFTLDTNTGAVYHQNGAMLAAEVRNSDFESEKRRLLKESREEFADTLRYPDEASREAWRLRQYRRAIMDNPLIWLRQSATWKMLIPDGSTFLELLGSTSGGKGTMGVFAKEGFFRALRHYFGGNYKPLYLLLPLLLPTIVLYCGAFGWVFCAICQVRSKWYELLIFLAFAEYYLLLPGSITAPRYQIPALPVLCVIAAVFIFQEFSPPVEKKEEAES